MFNENINVLNELEEIIDKHMDIISDYNDILLNYSYKKMSIGDGIYGMYFPESQLEKYFTYKGKLTNSDEKKDFAYYYDKDGKLIMTERYSNGFILNAILFYYCEDTIEIVWYCMKRKKINVVAKIVYSDNVLERFVESGDVTRRIVSFIEYKFNTNDNFVNVRSYMKLQNGKELIMDSRTKKIN